MRVFIAATLPQLVELHRTGKLSPRDGSTFAVTHALREWYTDGDADELEYAALIEAARAGATNGEMMVPMRAAFGWYVSE